MVPMDRKEYLRKYKKEYAKQVRPVQVTFSIDEYEILKKISEKEGVKVTPLVKSLALAQAQKMSYVTAEKQERLNEFVFLIRNIANNINQIAKHSNTVKNLRDENVLLDLLRNLEINVKKYVENDN